MKKIFTLSILSMISSIAFAQEAKTLFSNQNLSPVFCQLNVSSKTPSCVISIGAEAGTKLSSTKETTTDASGNVILAGVFPDSSFNSSLDETALPLVADGTDTTVPLYIRFAKQGGGGIPKPGTYVFSIPLTISY